jgi:ADP-ribose pyrophosphatase
MEKDKLRKELPAHAQMVFKGILFEVWQWEQELFDGTTTTFEKIWRHPTVQVIATMGDKLLIEEQDQPNRKNNISLAGGRADQGNDMLAEAKREFLEETGCVSGDWSFFWEHDGEDKVLQSVHYFIARNVRKVQRPELEAGERIETKLITFDEFLKLSDDLRFWAPSQFINLLFKMRHDEKKREEFRRLLFPRRAS